MHRQGVSALIALSAIGTLGCAAKDQAAARPDSTATAMAAPRAPAVVTIHAKDYAFSGPDTITAGMTRFDLVNDGPGLHHMQIVRLDSARTLADLQHVLSKPDAGAPPKWVVEVGGPNAPAPGTTANATLDLPAGNYALICFVDLPGGVPHFMKGMIRPLTVRPASGAEASAPTADVTVDLSDYAFTVSKPLTAGQTTFAVKNDGPQMHEIELIQLAPGKTQQDMLKWLAKMDGPPPGKPIGGIAAQPPGGTSYFSADLVAGDYVLVCFIGDAKDGKPHFMKGMIQTVKVS